MENIDVVAGRQHALITIGQLLASGVSEREVEHRVRTGRLRSLRRGVYRVEGGPISARQAILAAQLAAGPSTVVSHLTAAWLWDLEGVDQPARVHLLARNPERLRLDGVAGHCTNSLPAADVGRLDGIPLTAPARTVIDCCGEVPARAVDDLLRRGLLTLRQLARCADAVPASGRRRIRRVRAVLADRLPGYDPGGSARELNVLAVIRRAGLPQPRQRYRVRIDGRTYELDYAYPERLLGLEYDGWEYHRSRASFDADRARRNALQRHGWSMFNLTSNSAEGEVIAIITAAFAQLSAS